MLLFFDTIHGVCPPKEDGFESGPNCLMSPVFAENVCWVNGTRCPVKCKDACGNRHSLMRRKDKA